MAEPERTDVTCEDVESLSDAYFHGALSPRLDAALGAHIGKCEQCGHVIAMYRNDFYRRITIFNQGLDCEDGAWPDLTGWTPKGEPVQRLSADQGSKCR
jgi:hypothetical protein